MSSSEALAPPDVVVLGSANADVVLSVERVPAAGETLLATARADHAGGKGLNQAVACARAGAPTALLAAVGDDDAAQRLLTTAHAAGVATGGVRRAPTRTGTAVVLVAADGDNAIVVDAGANADLVDLREEELAAIRGARVLVAQLEIPLDTVRAGARAAHGADGADGDVGTTVILNAAPAATLPDDLLACVDVLVVNEHEAAVVAGAGDDTDVPALVEALLARVPTVVVTLGGAGAVLGRRGRDPHRVEAPAVDVVDTTGAGDTCLGYLAAGVCAGLDLADALGRAVVAASLSTTRAGATTSVPTAAQVDAFTASRSRGRSG